ncbi:MAG: tRNA lysidine(34) synthetase TilS [Atopobiaceae bacterium]|jgi:tRNA(Ile)-lysidine synthase
MPSVGSRYSQPDKRFDAGATLSSYAARSQRAHEASRAPVVLMVSGGADSTALLVLAATSQLDIDDGRGKASIARERLHVLHVNHQLRGQDADEDEAFVRQLATSFGIPCTVVRKDIGKLAASSAQEGGKNVELCGREVRYAAAQELANKLSHQFGTPRSEARILTAHTANDRAETFFMNAIKGSGPAGLSSIPRRRNRIVRPLLTYTHRELCDLLRMRNIAWREDATNEDTRYLRAFVRHELMPVVERKNPRITATLSTTCDILSDEDSYLTSVAARSLRELTARSAEGMLALDADKLCALEVAIARRVVRQAILNVCPAARLEGRHIESVLKLVAAKSGSCSVPISVDVRKEHGMLFIRTQSGTVSELAGWLEVPGSLALPDGRVLTARLSRVLQGTDPVAIARAHSAEWENKSILLDGELAGIDPLLGGRLWVDSAQVGDVICPLGMHGQSKKVSDLLCEAKIPAADKRLVPLVRIAPKREIVWVAPVRADERVKCSSRTKVLLELTLVEDRSQVAGLG